MHETSIDHSASTLPIVIDMTLYSAFIKSDSRLFVFHGFKQRQRLAFAHLAFFLLFGLCYLLVFIGRLLRVISCSAFDFAGKFLLRCFRGGRGGVFLFAFSLLWR